MKNFVGLITGGASGLGKASVLRLLDNGMRIVILDSKFSCNNDENYANMFSTVAEESIREKFKENCDFIKGDTVSTDTVQTAIDTCTSKWGKLNVVVNCAGSAMSTLILNRKTKKCCNYNAFRNVINTNICGTFNVIRLAAKHMAKNEFDSKHRERGVIINTAGIDAFKGCIHGSMNAASAGGLTSMTLPISRDLASLGIRVVAISPGYFKTPMLKDIPSNVENFLGNCNAFPSRLGQPIEFAAAVECIIENNMLNGETIQLDAAAFVPSFDIN